MNYYNQFYMKYTTLSISFDLYQRIKTLKGELSFNKFVERLLTQKAVSDLTEGLITKQDDLTNKMMVLTIELDNLRKFVHTKSGESF